MAIAAGSIAQIHKAILKNGQAVAIKIQRPGIDGIVEQDIALISTIAELVSRTNFGKYYDVIALAEEFSSALQSELDFTQEAHFTDQLRQNLAATKWFDPKQLVIPAINWELTSEKILVLEWLNGQPILTADLKKMGALRAIAKSNDKPLPPSYSEPFFNNCLLMAFSMPIPIPAMFFIWMMVALPYWTAAWWGSWIPVPKPLLRK